MKSFGNTLSLLLCAALGLVACGGQPDAPAPRYAAATSDGPMTDAYRDLVQRIYVAYFGRPADPGGLAYWADQYRAGAMPSNLRGLTIVYGSSATAHMFVDFFGTSQESRDLYPGDNAAFVAAIYRNIFSRDPEPAGLAYWVDTLDAGRMTRPIAALSMMAGAQGSDITVIDNKIAMATRFGDALNTPERLAAYSGLAANAVVRGMLATVVLGSDPAGFDAAIDAAIASLTGGAPPPPPPPPPPPVDEDLYFGFLYGSMTDGASKIGLMRASGGSATPALAATMATVTAVFMEGTVTNGTIRNGHPRSMVAWSNAHLVRQDLASRAGVPGNAQVSALKLNEVCGPNTTARNGTGGDLVDPARSWIVFRKPGPDRQCGSADDVFAAVRMDMGPNEAPRNVGEPLATVHASTGALSGWLVRNGQQVVRVEPDFSNPVAVFTLPASNLDYRFDGDGDANLFVFSSGNAVYAWDARRLTAGAPTQLTALASAEYLDRVVAANPDERFISIGSRTGGAVRVLRYTVSSGSVSAVGSASLGAGGVELAITPSRIVLYNVLSGATVSLPRAGGQARAIYTPPVPTALPTLTVAGERLWLALGSSTVIILNSDGSDVQTARDSTIGGCILRPEVPLSGISDACDAVLVIHNGSMRAFDAITGALRLSYGDLAMPPEPLRSYFSMNTASAWGQGAVLTQLTIDPRNPAAATISNYYFKSDQAGLTPLLMP